MPNAMAVLAPGRLWKIKDPFDGERAKLVIIYWRARNADQIV